MRRSLVSLVLLLACKEQPTAVAGPDPAPSTVAAPAASAPEASAPVDASAPDGGCGAVGLPPCPLQGWMKKNMTPAMNAQDFDALAAGLDTIVTFAPKEPGYPNWASIAKDGKNAAKGADLGAVRAACRGCHDQYKSKYRAELRTRPIPPP